MPRQQFGAGDVFRLMPLDDGRHGYGQIAAQYGSGGGHFYCTVFRSAHRGDVAIERVVEDDLVLLALTLDALLFHGYWEVVGRRDVQERRIAWPEYKEATAPDVFDVVDASGTVRRPATPEEVDQLPYRSIVAPIRVQRAFEALYGQRDWLPEYDELCL